MSPLQPWRRRTAVSTLAITTLLVTGCEEDPSGLRDAARLSVSTAVTGGGFDPDGYVLFIEGDQQFRRLEPVDTMQFRPSSQTVDVELDDVAPNCAIVGEAARTVAIAPRGPTEVTFVVSCSPPPELASIFLLFERTNGYGGTDLRRMRADGSEREGVIVYGAGSEPAVSADGSRIAFVRWTSDADELWQSEIRAVIPGVSDPVRVTDEGFVSSPTWSPDGQRLAYVNGDGWWFGEIRVRSVDGGDPTVLEGPEWGVDASPAWSPDGSRIAFSRWDETGVWWLYTMTPDGGDLLPIAEDGMDPVWSPAGDRIAFRQGRSAHLLPAEGGTLEVLVRGSGETSWQPTGWTADEQWVVLTRWRNDLGRSAPSTTPRSDIFILHLADGTLLRVTVDGVSRAAVPVDEPAQAVSASRVGIDGRE